MLLRLVKWKIWALPDFPCEEDKPMTYRNAPAEMPAALKSHCDIIKYTVSSANQNGLVLLRLTCFSAIALGLGLEVSSAAFVR